MVKLYEGGAYLVNGTELVPEREAARVLSLTGKEADKEAAKKGTMAYSILEAHNTSGDMDKLRIRFDSMTSHDITFVGIIQTAKASGMESFPLPYVLTNCHNSLCAVGGTINEDDHVFGLSACKKYGGIFVPPHIAVIHQYMREMMAGCGKMILGRTRDDAAGEAFDKVARAIGLGYPGGPKIDKLAKEGNGEAIAFPRAKIADSPYDFSFSGVKSAVLNYLNSCQMKGEAVNRADVAASFQKAVCDVLVEHAMMAVKDFGEEKLAIAGGVASNSTLRAAFSKACEKEGIRFYHPSPILCTDNAAMIGAAAYYEYVKGVRHGLDLNAVPNLKLGEQ